MFPNVCSAITILQKVLFFPVNSVLKYRFC